MTSSRSGTRTRRAAVCLAVLGLAAATSSPALAESGVPDVPIPSVSDVAEVATAVLEDASLTELPLETAVDPPPILPAVPAPTAAAEPVTVGAVAAPPPAPVVEAPAGVTPAPVVEQTGATNVSLSVRVDSPGDNGSVTQENVSAGDSQYQPDPPQYQAPIPVTADTEAEPAQQTTAPPADPTAAGSTWNWTWNCGDAIPEMPIDLGVASQNWNWNWDWNCDEPETTSKNNSGELGSQYQRSVTQYRPININISIRINSPGNDGPVVQTNIAVVVTPPALPRLPVALPGLSAGGAQSEAPALAVAGAEITMFFDIAPAEASDPDDCCVLPAPRGVLAAAPETQSVLLPRAPAAERRDITAPARFRASHAVTIRLAEASAAAARAARPSRKPARTVRPAPRRHPANLPREPVLALNAAGLTPLSAPDGRFRYIVLLLLAIGFSFAAASHTVAAEVRATGGESGAPPERPG